MEKWKNSLNVSPPKPYSLCGWDSFEIVFILAFADFVFIWNLVSFEAPRPFEAQATSAYSALIYSRTSLSNSFISNYRLSRGENLVPVLTWNYDIR